MSEVQAQVRREGADTMEQVHERMEGVYSPCMESYHLP
jgi:hypothetical protein